MTNDQLQFIDYRKPKLEAGEYTFTTKHLSESRKLRIRVAGERVKINPSEVFAQYPPAGETGDFADTLPHISFRKGTLPWIRSAYHHGVSSEEMEMHEPWLFLLLINEKDFLENRVKSKTTSSMKNLGTGEAFFPTAQKQSLLADKSLVDKTYVDTVTLKKSFFQDLLLGSTSANDKDQLKYLAHLRRRWKESGASVTLNDKVINDLDTQSCSTIRKRYPMLRIPATAKDLQVVKQGRTWLVQDAVQGDLLLELTARKGASVEIQRLILDRELSVLMANRFGQHAIETGKNCRNIAMVISLENYLNSESISEMHKSGKDWMQLLVLHAWDFYCEPVRINFEERSKKLNANALRYPDDVLQELKDFHLPSEGYVPVPHTFRNHDRGMSWYRGPLVPVVPQDWSNIHLTASERGFEQGTYVATDADKLLRYHPNEGMLDISYAAAYELGRALSLRQTAYLSHLRQYKKILSRRIKLRETDEQRKHKAGKLGVYIQELPYAFVAADEIDEHKQKVQDWLKRLADFSVLPFWYLVPDTRLLPERSVCTFNVDPGWIQALWLGALSLDGRPQATYEMLGSCWTTLQDTLPRAGAFLYSDIVWAYPELQTDFRNIDEAKVYVAHGQKDPDDLKISHDSRTDQEIDVREIKKDFEDKYTDLIEKHRAIEITVARQLKPDLMCFFTKAPFDYVSFALPPESLHYGADFNQKEGTNHGTFTKDVKYKGATVATVDVPLQNSRLGVVKVKALAKSLQVALNENTNDAFVAFDSSRFGRFMLEGEPKVEFTVGKELQK